MEHIKKVAVYDFDKTLAKTPENTLESRQLWEKHHQRPWPYRGNGWWYNLESLDPNVFDVELNAEVKTAAMQDIDALDVHAVLLTGRVPHFSASVKEICRKGGLPYFNDYFFNDSSDTLTYKLKILDALKETYPNVEIFEMWEDREAHIPHFIEWGAKNYGAKFVFHIIK